MQPEFSWAFCLQGSCELSWALLLGDLRSPSSSLKTFFTSLSGSCSLLPKLTNDGGLALPGARPSLLGSCSSFPLNHLGFRLDLLQPMSWPFFLLEKQKPSLQLLLLLAQHLKTKSANHLQCFFLSWFRFHTSTQEPRKPLQRAWHSTELPDVKLSPEVEGCFL